MTGGTVGIPDHGGWHSNVFGGGGGKSRYEDANGEKHFSITSGRVYGDTYVNISGGKVWHNVYGGGAIASVGTYDIVNPYKPYLSGGHTTVTITGNAVIGSDGNENGMVFASGRGEIAPVGHFLDSLGYTAYSTVTIGSTSATSNDYPKINGSVYGGGENGHTYLEANVNIHSGTIGCTVDEYNAMSAYDKEHRFPYRGNVYGAGCGTDQYMIVSGTDTTWAYNPQSGLVQGNTNINITGGYISHNVYGGGAMGSVGMINSANTVKHEDPATSNALSWPYEFDYVSIPDENGTLVPTGKATITVTGGHIGTYVDTDVYALANSGSVFGSARGEAGNRYVFGQLANAKETEVNVNYTNPGTQPDDFNVIVNSVYGGGENGHVYEDATVTIDKGFIGGSVFGAGKGMDTYLDTLKVYDPVTQVITPTPMQVHSITAGKVKELMISSTSRFAASKISSFSSETLSRSFSLLVFKAFSSESSLLTRSL